tara:strand:- start:1094 stop:1453 length:360 start_codon:yes stop_codon:yes gene_type:complete
MLRTNTKEYISNIKTAMQARFIDVEINDFEHLLKTFDSDFNTNNNKKIYPNLQNRISIWLQGGGGFNFIYDYDYLNFACKCHNLEKIPLNKQRIIMDNFNNHLAFFVIKFSNPKILNSL